MHQHLFTVVAVSLFVALFAGCPPPEGAPEADFSADRHYGPAPLDVQFTDLSLPIGAPITAWKWNFGDGSGSILQHPAHTFDTAGTYDITLTATNSIASDTLKKTAHIVVGNVWARTFGGVATEFANAICKTADNALVIAGAVPVADNGTDVYVAKYSSDGDLLWEHTYGGTGNETGEDIVETAAGDFLVTGSTSSPGALTTDVYLIKISKTGTLTWEKRYGAFGFEAGYAIAQPSASIIYIAGETRSYGPDFQNAYLVKVDANGELYENWPAVIEGPGANRARALCVSGDITVIAGETTGGDGGFLNDMYAAAIDKDGVEKWSLTYGDIGADAAYDIIALEGAFLMCGTYTTLSVSGVDMALVKIGDTGAVTSGVLFGGAKREEGRALIKSGDGNFYLLGQTFTHGAGKGDFWLVKADTAGDTLWDRTFGGVEADMPSALTLAGSGALAMTGATQSFGAGEDDGYILRTNLDGYGPSDPAE